MGFTTYLEIALSSDYTGGNSETRIYLNNPIYLALLLSSDRYTERKATSHSKLPMVYITS